MKNIQLKRNLLFETKKDKLAFACVLVASIFSALVTFLSIFSIYPLLQLMTAYDETINQFPMANVRAIFPHLEKAEFISLISLITICVLILSMLCQILENIAVSTYCAFKELWISSSYYDNFLTDSYKKFQQKNTSEEAKNILSDSNAAVGLFVQPMIQIAVASFTIIVLIGSMFIINAEVGLSIICLAAVLYIVIYYGLRRLLKRIGDTRTLSNENRFKLVDDAVSAMAEIKIHNAIDIFSTDFRKTSKRYAFSVVFSKVVAAAPKFLIEGLGAVSIVFYMRGMFLKNGNLQDMVAEVAIYVFILYRLLPQVQRLYASFTQLKFSDGFVSSISDKARIKDSSERAEIAVGECGDQLVISSLELEDITFKFAAGEKPIIRDFNTIFKVGYYYSIVGPSGSGKTCLLNIISGLNDDYKGSFRINGLDFRETDIQRYWKKVSYVPQDSAIFNGTIADNVALSGLPEIDRARVERSLEAASFGLQKLADANLSIDSRVGTGGQKLSGGQQQRIAIARAIYKRPNILILDEATSALDEESEARVLRNIKEIKDVITISVAHRSSAIEIADFRIDLNG